LRTGAALWFVPATIAVKVASVPEIARVPGAPADLLGIALVGGDIVPVVALEQQARSSRVLLVCRFLDETLGLLAESVVRSGSFETDGDGVVHDGERAPPLDLAAIYARLHAGRWAGKWRA
jgi:chemotaxis signal transduction protein